MPANFMSMKKCPSGIHTLVLSVAFSATSVLTLAQSSNPNPSGQPASDQVVELNPFEVSTTQGHGYVYDQSASAFKTTESLLKVPQIDTVITRDLIDDLGFSNSTDIVKFFGAGNTSARDDNVLLRGARVNYPFVDEVLNNSTYDDNFFIDTYELIKGPCQLVYLDAYLSGALLKTSKKPLPYQQDMIAVSSDQFGTWRVLVDSTGPVGSVGDCKVGYRLVAVDEQGNTYFDNGTQAREGIFPELNFTWKNTTIRTYYLFEKIFLPSTQDGSIPFSPSGDLFVTDSRRDNGDIPGSTMKYANERYFMSMDQHISDSAQNRLKVAANRLYRYEEDGSETFVTNVNWAAKTETWDARLDSFHNAHWAVLDDFQYNWDLGPLHNTDIAGGGMDDYTFIQKEWSADNFGFQKVIVPIYNSAAINTIVTPGWQTYDSNINAFPNQGSHTEINVFNLYFQHSVNIIPRWLDFTGGLAYSGIDTIGVANISSVPWTPTQVPVQEWLHRVGLILHPTKDSSIFVMDATAFVPNAAGGVDINNNAVPPQVGKDYEIGFKTAFFGGRLSADFAWFQMWTTNNYQTQVGAVNPSGASYSAPVGNSIQSGVEGDLSANLVAGWQVIGSFYAGHDTLSSGIPVAQTFDNSWGLFTRYDWQKTSPLHGFGLAAGVFRQGGRFASVANYTNATPYFSAWTAWSGLVKLPASLPIQAFANYTFNRHWAVKLSCLNVLNKYYAEGFSGLIQGSQGLPRTFALEIDCRR